MEGEKATSSQPCIVNPSPPLPDEVVDLILTNLGKEDLHSCRLVCREWNKAALRHLKKSSYVQTIHCTKLKDYVKFIRTSSAQIPLPFNLHVDGHINWRSVDEDVSNLLKLASPESIVEIVGLNLHPDNSLKGSALAILDKIAPGLLTLELSTSAFASSPAEELRSFRMNENILFPKLKKIRTIMRENSVESPERWELEFFTILFERSPVLEELDYGNREVEADGFEVAISFGHLRSLSFSCNRADRFYGLLLARIMSTPIQPTVETLVCELWEPDEALETTQLLEQLSPTLKSLTFLVEVSDLQCYVGLPVLPYLKHLKMTDGYAIMMETIYLNPSLLNLTPEFLPSLKSVTVPFGVYWDLSSGYVEVPFPTVEEVTVVIHLQDDWVILGLTDSTPCLSILNVQNFVKYMFQKFPNVGRLCLDTVGDSSDKAMYMRRIIGAIAEKPKAKWIQELEIRGYEMDYLGEHLLGLDPQHGRIPLTKLLPSSSMKTIQAAIEKLFKDIEGNKLYNLKFENQHGCNYAVLQSFGRVDVLNTMRKITLSSGTPGPEKDDYRCFQLDLNQESEASIKTFERLDLYDKYMPNLRHLNISSHMLSFGGRVDAWRVARQIESKFSNWTVSVI